MAREPQLLPGVPRERTMCESGSSIRPDYLVPPTAPTAPPPKRAPARKIVVAVQNDQEAGTESVRAQLARMQNDIEQLRRQLAAANARIDELRRRPAPR